MENQEAEFTQVKKARRGGNKAWEPTDEEKAIAVKMAGVGCTQDQIAAFFGVCDNTLRKAMGPELARGAAEGSAKVAQSLFRQAMKGDVGACVWFQKREFLKEDREHARAMAKMNAENSAAGVLVGGLLSELARIVSGEKSGGGAE